MTKVADIGSKRLISLTPDAWLQGITGLSTITAREFMLQNLDGSAGKEMS